jgi:hypothetical protein
MYEIVEVIGQGSTAKISKIKRREAVRRREPSSSQHSRSGRNSTLHQQRADSSVTEASSTGSNHPKPSTLQQPTKYFALKEIDVSMIKAEILDEFENEIKLLKRLVSAQVLILHAKHNAYISHMK